MDEKYENFRKELWALLGKHGLHMTGTIRLVELHDEKYAGDTAKLDVEEEVRWGGIRDTTGPFLVGKISEKPQVAVNCNTGLRAYVVPDAEPYQCPVTDSYIGGKAQHRDNLKRHGCHVMEKGEKEHAAKTREDNTRQGAKRMAREMVANIANKIEVRNWE